MPASAYSGWRKALWSWGFAWPTIGIFATLIGALVLPNARYAFTFVECQLLGLSALALAVRGCRGAVRDAALSLLQVAVSCACVVAQALFVPWQFIHMMLTYPRNPFWLIALWAFFLYALWAFPAWIAVTIVWLMRILRRKGEGPAPCAFGGRIKALLLGGGFIVAAAPAMVVLVMMTADRISTAAREQGLVWRHPAARVVREYLGALDREDYAGMARCLAVRKYSRETGEYHYMQDAPDKFPRAAGLSLEELARSQMADVLPHVRSSYDVSSARVVEVRPFQRRRATLDESGRLIYGDSLPPQNEEERYLREVVVSVKEYDQQWCERYFHVRVKNPAEPRIVYDTYMPFGVPEGCGGPMRLSAPLSYEQLQEQVPSVPSPR